MQSGKLERRKIFAGDTRFGPTNHPVGEDNEDEEEAAPAVEDVLAVGLDDIVVGGDRMLDLRYEWIPFFPKEFILDKFLLGVVG